MFDKSKAIVAIDRNIDEEMNTDGRDRKRVIEALEELKASVLIADVVDEAFVNNAEEVLTEAATMQPSCIPGSYVDYALVSNVMDEAFG